MSRVRSCWAGTYAYTCRPNVDQSLKLFTDFLRVTFINVLTVAASEIASVGGGDQSADLPGPDLE